MNKWIHCMITGECGKIRSFAVSGNTVKAVLAVCCFFVLGSGFGWFSAYENIVLRQRVAAMEKDLSAAVALNASIQTRTARQEQEQQARLDAALTDLKQKSKVIETILTSVGVKLEVHESARGAGGPFTRKPQGSYEGLTLKVDKYLDTIQSVPLGAPVPGTITSRFGGRRDPINGQHAFHSGIDIKNDPGTRVVATADGVVSAMGYDKGHGNFVEIHHGNSFHTRYFHLQKGLVKEGDAVVRGQIVGLLGNSGRSTGPHLHYEIRYQGKLIDPVKFIQVQARVAALEKQAARGR